MSKVKENIVEVLQFYLKHLGLDKFLHKDPTGAAIWEEHTSIRGTYYWGLNFKIEIEPMLENVQKQVADNLRGLSDSLEKSDWFLERQKVWDDENKKVIEALKKANIRVQELEKYETYYNMQMKMQHGPKDE